MKRLSIRIAALSSLVVLGLLAIAKAQKAPPSDEQATDEAQVIVAADDDTEAAEPVRRYDRGSPSMLPKAAPDNSTEESVASPRRLASAMSAVVGEAEASDDDQPAEPRSGLPVAPRGTAVSAVSEDAVDAPTEKEPARFAPARPVRETPRAIETPRSAPARINAGNNAAREIIATGDETSEDQSTAATEAPRSIRGEPKSAAPSTATGPAANSSAAAATAGGAAVPGSRELDGLQTPALSIEKVAPPEIQVGSPAIFEIRVQNTGKAVARNVQIIDRVPQGTRLIQADPRADLGEEGELIWNVPSLAPGASSVVKIELMPLTEGTIGSVASVLFRADAAVRTTATRPQLTLQVTAPQSVLAGQDAAITIVVSNPGTGAASRVVLEADVPPALKHVAGTELEFEVGTLKPGESRRLELSVNALRAGAATLALATHADGVAAVQQAAQIEIVAPQLEVAVDGPKRRFLDRKATHVVTVANPGTAEAREVELVAYLPRGMKFVEANNHGSYDAAQHAVYWSLEVLPARKTGDVQVTTIPTEAGDQTIRVEGKADRGLTDQHEETISVEGVSALSFQIADLNDPLEVGGQAQYEVRVVNSGSKSATNVAVTAVLPTQMAAVDATGNAKLDGNKIIFEPISRLAPKEEKVYRFRADATAAGDLRVRIQLTSDEMQQAVTQEESTRVFGDQ